MTNLPPPPSSPQTFKGQRILGLDPGLRITGWGIIDYDQGKLSYVAHGLVTSKAEDPLSKRLKDLYKGIENVITFYKPTSAALEEVFVNVNPASTLKLGMARGVILLVPSNYGLEVGEYAPNMVKKSIVGVGHASKDQMMAMVKMLLPRCPNLTPDSADALGVAICHAHHANFTAKTQSQISGR